MKESRAGRKQRGRRGGAKRDSASCHIRVSRSGSGAVPVQPDSHAGTLHTVFSHLIKHSGRGKMGQWRGDDASMTAAVVVETVKVVAKSP
ncbi:hypothetical protein E2C01_089122 [Portunus trituberculatus]|uniref:Uncharacterized protein n=1 Tax=Portunus trituberculatus TaxID=210409 RepID=A0A5B7JNQ4_PORTR|nr:hypothetical protein [Portunus trituberculatus]